MLPTDSFAPSAVTDRTTTGLIVVRKIRGSNDGGLADRGEFEVTPRYRGRPLARGRRADIESCSQSIDHRETNLTLMSKRNVIPSFVGAIEPILKRECKLLGLLLNDPGLSSLRSKAPAHPAVKRLDKINGILTQTYKLQYPNEVDDVLEIGTAALDGMTIGSGASPETVLASIDDDEVLRQLRKRAADPEQFSDQMAAFNCWNLLRENGMNARLVEKEGFPDIELPPAQASSSWIECKRIRLGSVAGRARKVIVKASSQIEAADPGGVGVVYIFIERPQQRVVFDDVLPGDVAAYVAEVERELGSGHSRNVATVVVGWDDYLTIGEPPQRTMYFLRRRSLSRSNNNSLRQLGLSDEALVLGRTVVLPISWAASTEDHPPPAPIRIQNIAVTQLFRQECELPGYVRSVHAIEAMKHPDGIIKYDLGGITMVLATKWVAVASPPYLMLLISMIKDADLAEIEFGFRLYPDGDFIAKDASPDQAFMQMLARYGLPVTVGDQCGLFIVHAQVKAEGGAAKLIKVEQQSTGRVVLSTLMKTQGTSPPTVDIAWAFAIDAEGYAADVRKHRR